MIGRGWPYWNHSSAYLLRSDVARHFRALTARGNGLAVVHSRLHTFDRQVAHVIHRVAVKRPSFSRSIIAQYQTAHQ